MFQVTDDPEIVWWPVVIKVPVDGGKTVDHKIECQFEILDDDAHNKLSLKGDTEFLKQVTKDWKHVCKNDETPLEFTKSNLTKLMRRKPYFRVGLIAAHNDLRMGISSKN